MSQETKTYNQSICKEREKMKKIYNTIVESFSGQLIRYWCPFHITKCIIYV